MSTSEERLKIVIAQRHAQRKRLFFYETPARPALVAAFTSHYIHKCLLQYATRCHHSHYQETHIKYHTTHQALPAYIINNQDRRILWGLNRLRVAVANTNSSKLLTLLNQLFNEDCFKIIMGGNEKFTKAMLPSGRPFFNYFNGRAIRCGQIKSLLTSLNQLRDVYGLPSTNALEICERIDKAVARPSTRLVARGPALYSGARRG